MSPKTGRPKLDNPKSIDVKARLDVETCEKLDKYCQKHEKTRSDVIRKGIDLVLNSDDNSEKQA